MTAANRVIYIGPGRRARKNALGRAGVFESESDWCLKLAREMEGACQEMTRRGLRLIQVVPVLSAATFKGSWTEGAWLFFGNAEPGFAPSEEHVVQ